MNIKISSVNQAFRDNAQTPVDKTVWVAIIILAASRSWFIDMDTGKLKNCIIDFEGVWTTPEISIAY